MPTFASQRIPGQSAPAYGRGAQKDPGLLLKVGIGMVLFSLAWDWTGRSSTSERILQDAFRIPHGVEFSQSRHPRRGAAQDVEGIVEFSKADYQAYIARMNNPKYWTPRQVSTGRKSAEPPFSPRALMWEKHPLPGFAGSSPVRWGNLSLDRAQKVKNGFAFCLALRHPPGERVTDRPRPIRKSFEHLFPLDTPRHLDRYNALHCSELGRSERPRGYIYGLLDSDTRTLHMIAD